MLGMCCMRAVQLMLYKAPGMNTAWWMSFSLWHCIRAIGSQTRRHACKSLSASHHSLCMSLTKWIAHRIDAYVIQIYCSCHDVHKASPSVRISRSNVRCQMRVHPGAIWDMIMEAKRSGSNVQMVAMIRMNDRHAAGNTCSSPAEWLNKRLQIYRKRRATFHKG